MLGKTPPNARREEVLPVIAHAAEGNEAWRSGRRPFGDSHFDNEADAATH